ncbi:MAG TPA: hypothetical protein VF142_16655 [Longimicrobium sp.]
MKNTRILTLAAGLLLAAACSDDPDVIVLPGGDPPGEPRDLFARYAWVLEGFDGTNAVGHPEVELTWLPPTDWNDEVFRVYGKRASSGTYSLIATVTSCTTAGCVYRDANVAAGTDYDYYVATYDEGSDQETTSEFSELVRVPSSARPAAPTGPAAVALDNAVFLDWGTPASSQGNVSKYLVYLTRLDGEAFSYSVGQTDGNGFLDQRAENGSEYGYRIATVDTLGHVSNLSAEVFAIPRPDFSGELLYAFADSALLSGFRFQEDENDNPILAGGSASAHFRLESDATGYRIVPLNGTQVTEFGFTTAIVCGPGSDAGCTAARTAPTSGYSTAPLYIDPEFSYVFRVTGNDGQPHYAVVRVAMLGTDQDGNDLAIFDWAYQLQPNEPQLEVRGR